MSDKLAIQKFEFLGEQAFGRKWRGALALHADITDRAIRYWIAGERPIPENIELALEDLAKITPTWPLLASTVLIEQMDVDVARRTVNALPQAIREYGVTPAVHAGVIALNRFVFKCNWQAVADGRPVTGYGNPNTWADQLENVSRAHKARGWNDIDIPDLIPDRAPRIYAWAMPADHSYARRTLQ